LETNYEVDVCQRSLPTSMLDSSTRLVGAAERESGFGVSRSPMSEIRVGGRKIRIK
jgi:hypothetical protein